MTANVIGYIATAVGTCMMLPQVIQLIRTRKAEDLSLTMAIFYELNCMLWFTYGLLISAAPVEWANGIGFMIGAVQLILKLRYDKGRA